MGPGLGGFREKRSLLSTVSCADGGEFRFLKRKTCSIAGNILWIASPIATGFLVSLLFRQSKPPALSAGAGGGLRNPWQESHWSNSSKKENPRSTGKQGEGEQAALHRERVNVAQPLAETGKDNVGGSRKCGAEPCMGYGLVCRIFFIGGSAPLLGLRAALGGGWPRNASLRLAVLTQNFLG